MLRQKVRVSLDISHHLKKIMMRFPRYLKPVAVGGAPARGLSSEKGSGAKLVDVLE